MKQIRLIAALVFGLLILGSAVGLMVNTSSGLAAVVQDNANQAADKISTVLLDKFQVENQADFIVKFQEQADLNPAYSMDWDARGEFVYSTLKETATRTQVGAKALLDGLGLEYRTFIAGNELYVWSGDLAAANMLAALPEVSSIRETRTYYIDPIKSSSSNPLTEITWAGDLLANKLQMTAKAEGPAAPEALAWGIIDTQADQFWNTFTVQGDGILVANIDTGVEYTHDGLDQAYKCGADGSDPACWEDPSNICGGTMCDNQGHGTHTMGTMVADDDPTLPWQAGMAPNAQWIACKGCETNSCSDFALNACADWILAPDGDPANRPHVVNNSWGGGVGSVCDTWYLPKVTAWRAAGTFPAFSAGNNSTCNSLGDPGKYQSSFGTTGHNVSRAHYGSMGPAPGGECDPHTPYTKPNISAPAVSVCSTVPGNSWTCGYTGTSMASPHTSGAVALLWSCNPGLIGQMDATFEALQNAADTPPAGTCGAPPDGEGNYTHGYGYLNVLAAGIANCGTVDIGTLDGHVYAVDTNDPIEGVTVVATPALANDNTIQAITDPNGYYTMTLLVGTYDVTASKNGWSTETALGVEILTGTNTVQDFYLEFLGDWQPGPSNAPFSYNRFDGVFNTADGWVYFPGGRTGASTHDKSIWRYDPANDVWEDTTCDMLYNASNITAVLVEDDGTGRGEAIYVVGGYDVVLASNIDDVQRYYPSEPGCVVEDIPTDLYPDNIGGVVVGAGGVADVNGKIYVFGGWISTGLFSDKTWEFDPLALAGSRWTQITDATLDPARSYIQSAAQGGLIYAMGGIYQYVGGDLVPTTTVEVFDPADPTAGWQTLAPLPVASAEGRGFGFDVDTLNGIQEAWTGKLYVVGGGDWSDRSAEVMEYDIDTNTWNQAFPDLLAARRDHAGAFVPICTPDPTDGLPGMWVFGGNIGADDPPFGDPEYYPFPCGDFPDLVVDAPPLEAELFPDQSTSLTFTIGNEGLGPLNWNLYEMTATVRLSGETLVTPDNQSRDVELSLTTPAEGSIQAGSWEPLGPVELILDDGTVDGNFGVGSGGIGIQFLWLNRFTPDPGDFPFQLEEIAIAFCSADVPVDGAVDFMVYEDTDGDEDPSNGVLLATYHQTVQANDCSFNVYMLPTPLALNGPGDVLIAAVNRYLVSGVDPQDHPASIDLTLSQERSWIGWYSADPPDPAILPPDVLWTTMDDLGYPGNWLLRGSGTTIDDVDLPWLIENPIVGTIPAGEVQVVTVTFDSTGLTPGVYNGQLLMVSNDPDTPQYTMPVALTVWLADVDVDPAALTQAGDPGETVTYEFQVANLGNYTDTFDITASGNAWAVNVLDPVVTLPPNGVADVMVEVVIPPDALATDSDVATITATSQGYSMASDSTELTTTVNQVYGVELIPETATLSGAPGERVEYTLTVVNTGNGTDTFDITFLGSWNVHLPETSVTVAGHESVDIIVHVDIPATASDGDSDQTLIKVTSQGDPTLDDSSELTTVVVVEAYTVNLPIIQK